MSRDPFKILGASLISQEWLKIELSNFYTGRLHQVFQGDDKSHLKEMWLRLRDPFLHAELTKILPLQAIK